MTNSETNPNGWQDIGRTADIGPNEQLVYTLSEKQIIVVNIEHEFYALDNVCTHDGGSLSGGGLEDHQLVCPRHGAHFCVKTGEALTPPAYEAVNTYPVRVIDGRLQVKIH